MTSTFQDALRHQMEIAAFEALHQKSHNLHSAFYCSVICVLEVLLAIVGESWFYLIPGLLFLLLGAFHIYLSASYARDYKMLTECVDNLRKKEATE